MNPKKTNVNTINVYLLFLFFRCIKYISANLCAYKNSGYLELFPIHIKDRIIIYVTRILKGFHDDDLLETLLHENLINIDLSGSTISDRTLKSLATYCPNLKKIVMSRARYLFSEQGKWITNLHKINAFVFLSLICVQLNFCFPIMHDSKSFILFYFGIHKNYKILFSKFLSDFLIHLVLILYYFSQAMDFYDAHFSLIIYLFISDLFCTNYSYSAMGDVLCNDKLYL